MGFSNPIIGGGGSLVYPSIHSPNFVHNISGWTIKKDGSAEFNNLSIRGTFNGNNFILNSTGFFLYRGTPALGNLAGSFVPANITGTDQFGNTFLGGETTYVGISGAVTGTIAQSTVDATTTFYYSTSTNGSGSYRATGQIVCEPSGSNTGPNIMLFSVFDNTGSSTAASFELQGTPSLGGMAIGNGALISTQGTQANPTKITTDNFTGLTLTNPTHWTQVVNLAIILDPDNTVTMVGELNNANLVAAGEQLTSIPAGLRPTSNARLSANFNTGTATVGAVLIAISSGGTVTTFPAIPAGSTLNIEVRWRLGY